MPAQLPVPYYPQKAKGYCLAACVQMVLHYWGVQTNQERLARQLGVEPGIGVAASHVKRLASCLMAITYEIGEWDDLQDWLANDVPVIAMIQAGELPYWQGEQFQHAVVVIGHDSSQVLLLDPAAQPTPISVSIDEFMLAWGEMDYRYAVLEPKSRTD